MNFLDIFAFGLDIGTRNSRLDLGTDLARNISLICVKLVFNSPHWIILLSYRNEFERNN